MEMESDNVLRTPILDQENRFLLGRLWLFVDDGLKHGLSLLVWNYKITSVLFPIFPVEKALTLEGRRKSSLLNQIPHEKWVSRIQIF